MAFDLKDDFEELMGIDFSPDRIAEARREVLRQGETKMKFQVAGANAIPSSPEYFDLITVAQAFQYFSQPDSIQEINRVLKKDGILS